MIRIFLSFVVLFSLACSDVGSLDRANNNLNPESPLEIFASTMSPTKGEVVEVADDMGSIGLYCALTGDNDWSSSTQFSKMVDRRFYITNDGDWEIDGESEPWGYESLSDKYTFFAYSPYCKDTQGVTPSIEDGELTINYIVPNNSIDQPDLMYALPRKDIYAQVMGGVSLTFYHALTCVSFGVVSTTGEKITSIDITGVLSKGSLKWDYDSNSPQWSFVDSTTDSFSVEVDDYTLDDDNSAQVNTDRGYLMMIPQTLTNGAEVTLTLDSGEEKSLIIPAGSEWKAGAKLNYIINLDDGDFIFDSDEISNCYIINPTPGIETIVQIPIEDRINDFWKNYSGDNKKKITATTTTDEFIVVRVWDDFDSTFSFEYTVLDDKDDKMAVYLTIPAEFQEGNFVFAVEKYDDDNSTDRVWSWHLWFTDYNPDAIAYANQGRIVDGADMEYTRTNYEGAVHRYKDGKNSTVWSDIYKDKFIMDRNIGERNEYATNYGAGAVYYQFGRKDPFPGYGAKYSGTKTEPSARSSSGFSFSTSVELSHDFFISTSSSSDNWSIEEAARQWSCIWFDENISNTEYTVGKSIFDPSPLGWRVPVSDTWSYFNETGSTQDGSNVTKSVGIYNYYGFRNPNDEANLNQGGDVGYVWSANPTYSDTASCLFISDELVTSPFDVIMTYGLPIRAIQE